MKCQQISFYLHLVFGVSAATLCFFSFLSLSHFEATRKPFPCHLSDRVERIDRLHFRLFFTVTQTLKPVCVLDSCTCFCYLHKAFTSVSYILVSHPPPFYPPSPLPLLSSFAVPRSLVQHKMPSVWLSGKNTHPLPPPPA